MSDEQQPQSDRLDAAATLSSESVEAQLAVDREFALDRLVHRSSSGRISLATEMLRCP